MIPTFTFPLAFLGLLAIPALLAIYWLRSRFRRHPVSSLMLWLDQRQAREGGTVIHRLQTPLPLFLELAAILLLTTAAAGPLIHSGERLRPLMVVLDDSFSMRAGGGDTPRSRALVAIEKELRREQHNPVQFVLAGESPRVLAEPTSDVDQAIARLENWRCLSPTAHLEEAISFAFEIGGKRAHVLVVTDQTPSPGVEVSDRSPLQWRAVGRSQPNVAFVNATRTLRDEKERCLLEIANLSSQAARATLTISDYRSEISNTGSAPNPQSPVSNPQSLDLAPHEMRRIIFELKSGAPPVRARLSDDLLGLDNEVVLMPDESEPVPVEIRIRDEAMRRLISQAIEATERVALTPTQPDLIITDHALAEESGSDTWVMQILKEEGASAYLGPFVLDRAHPLTEGLLLGGVVWGAGNEAGNPSGAAVIMAGNVALLTDLARPTGRHDLRVRWRPDLSTLQASPNWPVLFWNLIAWRASERPGLSQTNLRLGADVMLRVEPGTNRVEVVAPDGSPHQLTVRDNRVVIKAETAGVYEFRTNGDRYQFASNVLSQSESDLTDRASGQWGDWTDPTSLDQDYRSIAWVFLLLALGVLTVHLTIITARTGRY